jgi:peptidoglycan/LPS O-acetylase OafA/YrhL
MTGDREKQHMDEVFPFLGGIVLGLVSRSRTRTPLFVTGLAVIACCIAIVASYISGEVLVSWWYVAIDLCEVIAAAVIVALLFGPARKAISDRIR